MRLRTSLRQIILKQLDAQTNFEGVDKVQQKNAQNMTSALKRDMKNTSDGVEITAIGTAFYHKMDRASANQFMKKAQKIY